jgi:hypothetical protein
MKRSAIVIGLLLACSGGLGLRAQTPSAQDAQQGQKEHSMTGCLQKGTEAGTFRLTNVENGPAKTVEITDSTANLAPHIGHKVEITGEADTGTGAATGAANDAQTHAMKVTGVKMLSPSCP